MAPPKTPGHVGKNYAAVIKGSYSARITVTNSTFYANMIKEQEGTIIATDAERPNQGKGSITVTDSCFVGNTNLAGGLILVNHPNGGIISRNHKDNNDFFSTTDPPSVCEGLFVPDTPSTNSSCTTDGFNMTECSILPTTTPPTPAPTVTSTTILSMSSKLRDTIMLLSFVSMYLF